MLTFRQLASAGALRDTVVMLRQGLGTSAIFADLRLNYPEASAVQLIDMIDFARRSIKAADEYNQADPASIPDPKDVPQMPEG